MYNILVFYFKIIVLFINLLKFIILGNLWKINDLCKNFICMCIYEWGSCIIGKGLGFNFIFKYLFIFVLYIVYIEKMGIKM